MNKIFTIMLMMMSVGVTAHAGESICRVYDYQEMKDMTDEELKYEIDHTMKFYDRNSESAERLRPLSGKYAETEFDKAWKAMVNCREQNSRLLSTRQKRPSMAIKPLSYEQCVERGKLANLPEDKISQFCDKYK